MTLRLPPGMARPHIPPNPNTMNPDLMWEFACLVISLEPNDFVFAGIYADKSGYHNSVKANLSRWPNTYSVKLAADLNGDRTKARALDIKSKQAASGAKPTIMAKYGARMRAAAKARDPRVRHWREVLGQFDTDTPPEAIDFQSLVERQPDDTHEWHFHWSMLAMYLALALAYEGMLSVLYGESLDSWNRYAATGGDDMSLGDPTGWTTQFTWEGYDPQDGPWLGGTLGNQLQHMRETTFFTKRIAIRTEAKVVALTALLQQVLQVGSGDFDVAALMAHVDEKLEALHAETRDAIADGLEGGAVKVRADADD